MEEKAFVRGNEGISRVNTELTDSLSGFTVSAQTVTGAVLTQVQNSYNKKM